MSKRRGDRDRLIHHYFGINYEIVWRIVTEEVPEVASGIQEALDEQTGE